MTRVYLPTAPELIDRLSIVQLKSIFISERKADYDAEIALIEQDINTILAEKDYRLTAQDVRAIIVLAISNRYIWENESKARAGGSEQDALLKTTHSINGVRATAKNRLANAINERLDYKVDALSADLPSDMGNWRIW